ncbi:alpha-ketoglutarate dependent xanthine dioxygenase [Niveomyces insectorum RCEF 264]|uniref:Alpha-ketoglutarate dependent xanthine dioxygenase n=1 Tax=Niveomyces insectorum RCEF 264 TaxID=1081102 RepID=A0A167UVP1_9HYPO|nr:alpha-ketoglutarate dependent xanthine dioxygenase [Niveomyces insectorum RCEF 264]
MSPSVLKPEPSFTLTLLDKSPKEKHNFGAVIEGLNLDDISDEDVQALSDAIWTHKVVVVKGQQSLHPAKQWELVTRFDPNAPQVHSHGDTKTFNAKGGLLSKGRDVYEVPGVENVRIIGKGYQGKNHYGLEDVTIYRPPLHEWHAVPLSDAEFAAGHTRFQRWHIDAPLYDRDPAWFTTLRCIHRPTAPQLTVHWDDGSGHTLAVDPGLTAFVSNVQCYALLTPDEKQLADHSWVEYAPHPYMWLGASQSNPNGLGLADSSVGKELSLAAVGDYDPAKVKRYPMVWVNPVTGERAFMVHGICVRRMFLRRGPDEAPEVVEDLGRIRRWLRPIQERVLKPEYILVPKAEPGDIVMWANYQLFHTAIDYPEHMGPRTMHQANIGASTGPVGPVPVPAAV